jgi:hypothetical protein
MLGLKSSHGKNAKKISPILPSENYPVPVIKLQKLFPMYKSFLLNLDKPYFLKVLAQVHKIECIYYDIFSRNLGSEAIGEFKMRNYMEASFQKIRWHSLL